MAGFLLFGATLRISPLNRYTDFLGLTSGQKVDTNSGNFWFRVFPKLAVLPRRERNLSHTFWQGSNLSFGGFQATLRISPLKRVYGPCGHHAHGAWPSSGACLLGFLSLLPGALSRSPAPVSCGPRLTPVPVIPGGSRGARSPHRPLRRPWKRKGLAPFAVGSPSSAGSRLASREPWSGHLRPEAQLRQRI